MAHDASTLAALGGRERAKQLTSSQRKEIARGAAQARWGTLPRATHTGSLQVGDIEFDCAVLEDGTRVVSETRFMAAMGMYRQRRAIDAAHPWGRARTPGFLCIGGANLKPFVEKHLGGVHFTPVQYISPQGSVVSVGIAGRRDPERVRSMD